SADGVTLRCGLGPLELSAVATATMPGGSGEDFVLLSLPDQTYTGEVGKPNLPLVSAVLDVPQGAEIELAVDPGEQRTVALSALGIAQRIAPALAPLPKREGARPRFALDAAAYSSDSYYPATLAEIDDIASYAGLARGHRLAAVRFHPVQYDPAAGTIRYYPRLTATVTFRHGDRAGTAALVARDYSRDWEGFIRRLAVNGGAAADSLLPLPVYYDIIYGGMYANAAKRLAAWKRRCGYAVRMWNASGWDSLAIRDTIRAQSPHATYVVLISDPDGSDRLPPSASGSSTGMATDLYYAETGGFGYLPDLFNARISVKTADEADAAIGKLIRYEQADFGSAGTAWLKKAVLIAGYDWSMQPLCVATNEYCRQILARAGYTTIDTLIMADGEGRARAVASVNVGRAWTIYTAHGSITSWVMGGADWYASTLGTDLSNQDMYTAPMGHCCYSGDFMSGGKGPGNYDCFGETWPKLDGKGGVTYFGSVDESYWDEDDWLQRRYFDALYDSLAGVPGPRLDEIGRFTQYGLFWINDHTASPFKQYYFETYHLFNDPAMDFWTDAPRTLAVTHQSALPASGPSLTVAVRDSATGAAIGGAMVCALNGVKPELQATAYTDSSGSAVLPLTFTEGGDTVLVTATRHDFRPYQGYAVFNFPVNVAIAPRSLDVRHAALVSVQVTDPDSGNAPVPDVSLFLVDCAHDTTLAGVTDTAGRAQFTARTRDRHCLTLYGRRSGATKDLFRDTIGSREEFAVTVAPRTVNINEPTPVSVNVSDTVAGGPVDSVVVCLVSPRRTGLAAAAADTAQVAVTDAAGRASFTADAAGSGDLRLLLRWDRNGYTIHEDTIRVAAPAAFTLLPNAPNPFSGATAVRYNLPWDAAVDISLYNLLGQKIRTLVAGAVRAGYHTVTWNGTNQQGGRLASGVYFCRFSTPWSSQVQRMVLIR
ncbi:MAG TPA: C25 family cysteine peptidase, partial [Candidatus Edwardsbacteria bacterium]|nr:C25 family cysteine peptidase [Candidatus Edwardsbacteria bacterium]